MVNTKRANALVARIIPLVLLAIASYSSYTVIGQLCVAYLLAPKAHGFANTDARPGAAVAIIVIFCVLLFFVAITYFRIIYTVTANQGYVPLSEAYHAASEASQKQRRRRRRRSGTSRDAEKGTAGVQGTRYEETSNSRPSPASEQPGLAHFYNKDFFVCEGDGRPPWCTVCRDWKPDRAHHCREVQRCVRKMDHFCPWVGGIVSETNFKFFVQFTTYTVLICAFSIIVLAFFLADLVMKEGLVNVHFCITITLLGMFFMFCVGMSGISTRYILRNITSIERLSEEVKVWTIAVHLPDPPPANAHPNYQMITFPLVIDPEASHSQTQRTFAILHSRPGENPFDLGTFGNWQSVMGYTLWDWLLPIRYSPCCDHSSVDGDYQTGPAFELMKQRAGMLPSDGSSEKRHRRRHSSHRDKSRANKMAISRVIVSRPKPDAADTHTDPNADNRAEQHVEEDPDVNSTENHEGVSEEGQQQQHPSNDNDGNINEEKAGGATESLPPRA